jgi:hypothetical protein
MHNAYPFILCSESGLYFGPPEFGSVIYLYGSGSFQSTSKKNKEKPYFVMTSILIYHYNVLSLHSLSPPHNRSSKYLPPPLPMFPECPFLYMASALLLPI